MTVINRSREYFNRHYDSPLAHGGYWHFDYRYTLDIIGNIQPEELIDIGCGTGAFLSLTEKTYPKIHLNGLDLSEGMVKETRSRLDPSAVIRAGNAEDMPLDSNSYDVLTCNMSIHHYPHPQNAVNEMYRVLKPGGYLLLNDMDCITPVRYLANIVFPLLPAGDVKMYSQPEILHMLDTAGFRCIEYRKLTPFTFLCTAQKPKY